MHNLFVVNSPLQYLIARIIAEEFFPTDSNVLLHYTDQGDFRQVFDQTDRLRGHSGFAQRIAYTLADDTLPDLPLSRLFLSNRFNAIEARIFRRIGRKAQLVCGFEDGIAFYLPHYFRTPSRRDGNPLARLQALGTRLAERAGLLPRGKTRDFFPMAAYDEVYSVLPEVPGTRSDARHVDLSTTFKAMCGKAHQPLPGACLVLSQSLAEDGLVEPDAYRRFLEQTLERLREQHTTIFFKAHPRERSDYAAFYRDLGCEHLPPDYAQVPAELFLAAHPGVTTYGFWSTTLAYGQLLSTASVTFGAAIQRANAHNPALAKSWQAHAPILHRFGVTDW